MTTTALIPIEEVNAVELFTKDGELDALLKRIDKEASSLVPDLETATGRKKIASNAHDVSKCKTVIENAGKDLVADWKNKAKVVDVRRRHSREFCDEVRDRVRQPLTDYEAEQIRIAEEERLAAEFLAAEVEAYAEHDIYLREKAVKEKEAEIARQKEERQRIEAEERAEKEQAAHEEKIRVEAAERAEREAAEAVAKSKREFLEALDKEEAKLKAERERAEQAGREAKEAAEQAERDRIEAKERAERDKAEAIEQERRRAEAQVAEEKRQADARAADIENRRKVNNKIVAAFRAEGMGQRTAQSVVRLVASGAIPHMGIRY